MTTTMQNMVSSKHMMPWIGHVELLILTINIYQITGKQCINKKYTNIDGENVREEGAGSPLHDSWIWRFFHR